MNVDLLLGLQWGDEGKGKIVDVLTKDYDMVARFQGGPNAGHTLEFDGIKHVLHTIPSGIFHENSINLIGNGVVIDPVIFQKEIEKLEPFNIDFKSKLFISRKAHLILPTHRLLDAASELSKGKSKIGSTLKGIGPTYMDKTGRNGIRVGDIELEDWLDRYEILSKEIVTILRKSIDQGGTTLRDFVGSDNKPGYFKQQLEVYGRQGKACQICSSILKNVIIGQRSSVYCPQCQK